ncbi:hypothetical protein KJZ67_02730 [Patescibacteria group bacterium]|jgi:hypothetical protein|nr:hypothetical protein [Patescibacteria group bacterium]
MSAEHGGHGSSGGGIFFIEGVTEPSEEVWASIFDIFTLFVVGLFAMFDTPVKSEAH